MNWSTYVNENGLPDVAGSDGGIIVADEEHPLGARITLERASDDSAFSITCGIYQWMMHTCHFATLRRQRSEAFDAMKPAISTRYFNRSRLRIRSRRGREDGAAFHEAISRFVDEFP